MIFAWSENCELSPSNEISAIKPYGTEAEAGEEAGEETGRGAGVTGCVLSLHAAKNASNKVASNNLEPGTITRPDKHTGNVQILV